MADNGTIFSAMLQEFDGAARILNLEPGIWKILTHPKRQIDQLCASVRQFGFTNPVLIDEQSVLIAGHGLRCLAGILAAVAYMANSCFAAMCAY